MRDPAAMPCRAVQCGAVRCGAGPHLPPSAAAKGRPPSPSAPAQDRTPRDGPSPIRSPPEVGPGSAPTTAVHRRRPRQRRRSVCVPFPLQRAAVLSRPPRRVDVAVLEGGQVGEGRGAGAARAGGLAAAGGDDVGAVRGDEVDYPLLDLRRGVSSEMDGALHST